MLLGQGKNLAIELEQASNTEAVAEGVAGTGRGLDTPDEPAARPVAVGHLGPVAGGGQAVGDAEESQFEHKQRGERQGATAAVQAVQAGQLEHVNDPVKHLSGKPGRARTRGEQSVTSLRGKRGSSDGEGEGVGGRGKRG